MTARPTRDLSPDQTQIDQIAHLLRDGEEWSAEKVQAHVPFDASRGSISASLAQLRQRREATGVIRTRPGIYRYAPDDLDADAGDGVPKTGSTGSIAEPVIEALRARRGAEMQSAEVAEATGFSRKQVAQALTSSAKRGSITGVERVRLGVYRYNENAVDEPPLRNGGRRPTQTKSASNRELEPVLDAIPDEAWDDVGLRVVARTKEGYRVAVDENGTAWVVEVTINARLL